MSGASAVDPTVQSESRAGQSEAKAAGPSDAGESGRGAARATAEELIARLRSAVRLGEEGAIAHRIEHDLTELIEAGLELPAPLTRPRPDSYARRLLHREADGSFSVVVMTWGPGQRTPIHDHAGIWCVEGVVDGRMRVERFELLGEEPGGRCRFAERGEETAGVGSSGALIPPFEHHVLANALDDRQSITLHVYGGDMDHCCTFEPAAEGTWQRRERQLSFHDP